MERIIKGVSDALGVKTKFRFYSGPPAVHNDKALTDLSTQVATKMNLNIISPSLSMAGEDFSFYQQEIPGSFVLWERAVHMNGIILLLQLMKRHCL